MMAFSPPPFLTFSLNSRYLPESQRVNGWQAFILLSGVINRRKEQNLLLTAGVAVSEVSFVNMLVNRQQGLLQQREGTMQSSSPSGC